jgi:hypothetical protein
MQGKKLSEFIDSLYSNPEMEIEYHSKKYLISGYRSNDGKYILQVDSIEESSVQLFYCENEKIETCIEEFEKAKMFDGKTIYEAEHEVNVLYG